MINQLIDYLKEKKILILGFGAEGKSTYELIRKYLPTIPLTISDKKDILVLQTNQELQKDSALTVISGEFYLEELNQYDCIIKSPGVCLKQIDTSSFSDKITSQLELLLQFFPVSSIGITGTKGKSTTSTLIYTILKEQKKDALLLGNIGIPIFQFLEEIHPHTILVLELSAHQLQYVHHSPQISILLNLFPEHLDFYSTLGQYVKAKFNIAQFQKKDDYFLYNADNPLILDFLKKVTLLPHSYAITYENNTCPSTAKKVYQKEEKIYLEQKPLYCISQQRKLVGVHNLNNIMFALAVSEILQLNLEQTIQSIQNFSPLPHRIELVGKYDGVIYYDDAIATIPEATIQSIEALENVNTLIIGGMDRGIDLSKIISFLNTGVVEHVICMPTTGNYIGEKITNPKVKVYFTPTLEQAVQTAKKQTKKEQICLLSPSGPSYEFFQNFKEKGDKFQELVKQN